MTDFNNSHWAKAEFAKLYRENADIFILERRKMLSILQSFYQHFIGSKPDVAILDLGCGDGIVAQELLKIDHSIAATLIDASEDMLNKAKERLKEHKNTRFVKASFQDILNKSLSLQPYDLIVSSLAIHHLSMEEKAALFEIIHASLNQGGYFLNIDVLLSPSKTLEQWYLKLWQEWMEERKTALGIEVDYYAIIQRYKDSTDNKPDTLDSQLNDLKSAGFQDIDCFYKYGIFSIYGGRK